MEKWFNIFNININIGYEGTVSVYIDIDIGLDLWIMMCLIATVKKINKSRLCKEEEIFNSFTSGNELTLSLELPWVPFFFSVTFILYTILWIKIITKLLLRGEEYDNVLHCHFEKASSTRDFFNTYCASRKC